MNAEAKISVGKVTVDIGQALRNVAGTETDREKKSFLNKVLDPQKADDNSKDAEKAEKIAKKIARGESVTPQEKSFLMKFDPKLAQLAELARKEGERVRHALRQASSKEEQQNVVHEAYQMVMQVSKKNPQFGALLGEAVKAAVQDGPKKGDLGDADGGHDPAESVREKRQAMEDRFFPEEQANIMDCRG